MRVRRLVHSLLGCLVLAPLAVQADEPGIATVSAIPPQTTPFNPNERPTELPNIHPDDIAPLLKPPVVPQQTPRPPRRPLLGNPSDYDGSRLFLPDNNPGERQPPCPCLPLGRYWISASYFLGVTEEGHVPALANNGGNFINGLTSTRTIFGNQGIEHPFRSGMQLETGAWLDHCQNWGIEGSFFLLETNRNSFSSTATGNGTLARPYLDAVTGQQVSMVLANPSSFAITSPTSFVGAGINLRKNLICEDNYRLDFISGYRFVSLSESLTVASHDALSTGGVRALEDTFRTANQFHGKQIGLAGEYRFGDWNLNGALKIAFGETFIDTSVEGHTTNTIGNQVTSSQGGFLTGPGNLGNYSHTRFAVLPEATFRLGYQLTEHCRVSVGYNFLYLSQVARPGNMIDTTIGTGSNGVLHPAIPNPMTDFWMQGITFGLEARY